MLNNDNARSKDKLNVKDQDIRKNYYMSRERLEGEKKTRQDVELVSILCKLLPYYPVLICVIYIDVFANL